VTDSSGCGVLTEQFSLSNAPSGLGKRSAPGQEEPNMFFRLCPTSGRRIRLGVEAWGWKLLPVGSALGIVNDLMCPIYMADCTISQTARFRNIFCFRQVPVR
jgi:hypothetical protein